MCCTAPTAAAAAAAPAGADFASTPQPTEKGARQGPSRGFQASAEDCDATLSVPSEDEESEEEEESDEEEAREQDPKHQPEVAMHALQKVINATSPKVSRSCFS